MFYKPQQKSNLFIQGQTLIETIVACGIMILGITAILTLALATLSMSRISKERIVALNLVREGIEIVRAIRDTNWLQNDLCWDTENDFCGLKNGSWIVDYQTINLEDENLAIPADVESINGCLNCQLKIDNNLYNFSNGSPTVYERMITISDGDIDEEKKIVSQILWQERNRTHSIELETRLTNWR